MPHPNFNTDSEMNSYWRHYYNHIESEESKKDDEERRAANRAARKKNKKQQPPAPKPNRQGLVAAEDGWFTVVSTKKH